MKRIPIALALSLVASGALAEPPTGVVYTQTAVALTGNASATLVAADIGRKALCIEVIGTGRVTLALDATAAVLGSGWALNGAGATGDQGGAYCWDAGVVPTNRINGISATNNTVIVWAGH